MATMQFVHLSRRSVVRLLRQPALIVPTFILAVMSIAVNQGSLGAMENLPGFPADSYITFGIAGAFMMANLFAPTLSGVDIANDVKSGFLNRIALAPINRMSYLISTLAGNAVIGLIQGVGIFVFGALVGATFHAGIGGFIVLLLLNMCIALAFGSLGVFLAIRTGSAQAVSGLFAFGFLFFFLSTVTLPRNLMIVDWFRAIASANPLSYMVDALRSLYIVGWDMPTLLTGFVVALLITLIALGAAARALRERLA